VQELTNKLVSQIDEVVRKNDEYPQPFLSERLANAGYLPMFGFPTRMRNLYQRRPQSLPSQEGVIDREIDLAIGEFAPGSEIVKDKTVFTSVGLVHYQWDKGRIMAADGKGVERRLGHCAACGALKFTGQGIPSQPCEICEICGSDDYSVITTWQPLGFTTEPYQERDYNGNFDWVPRALRARLGSDHIPGLELLDGANIRWLANDQDVTSLNDNDGKGFDFKQLKNKPIWVATDCLEGIWKNDISVERSYRGVGLVSTKKTDVLLMRIHEIPTRLRLDPRGDQGVYARAAYYSWGHLMRKAACDFLDIEPSELAVNIRPLNEGNTTLYEIFLMDTLDNGAGYCQYLGDPVRLRKALLEPLAESGARFYERLIRSDHLDKCDSTCNECLRDYESSDLHGLLDWRLGLDLARLSIDSNATIALDQPYWKGLTEKAVSGLANLDPGIRQVENQIVKLPNGKRVGVVHPLWSEVSHELETLKGKGVTLFQSVFDIIRRPGWILARISGG